MNIDPNRQYGSSDLPSDIYNVNNGDIKNYNGRAVQVFNNGNGTRRLSDLGDYATYQAQQDLKNAAAQKDQQFQTMVGQGKQDVTDFLTKFSTDVPTIIGATQAKYQIPQQVDLVNSLNSRISQLQTNSTNEGAGGYASAGQVDAAVTGRYLPQYTAAMGNLNTSEQAAQSESAQLLQPDITEGTMLNDRLAREMTGFSADQQATLGALIDKLKSGVTLTTTEMNNANALAVAQKAYDSKIAELNAPQNRIVAVPAADKVFQVSPSGSTTSGTVQPLSLNDLSAWIKDNT